eukprot:m.37485 g.37485  ORF g.37485 m.37485 type:complete len:543 (-) comp17681_c0_seq1:112-1740(-)
MLDPDSETNQPTYLQPTVATVCIDSQTRASKWFTSGLDRDIVKKIAQAIMVSGQPGEFMVRDKASGGAFALTLKEANDSMLTYLIEMRGNMFALLGTFHESFETIYKLVEYYAAEPRDSLGEMQLRFPGTYLDSVLAEVIPRKSGSNTSLASYISIVGLDEMKRREETLRRVTSPKAIVVRTSTRRNRHAKGPKFDFTNPDIAEQNLYDFAKTDQLYDELCRLNPKSDNTDNIVEFDVEPMYHAADNNRRTSNQYDEMTNIMSPTPSITRSPMFSPTTYDMATMPHNIANAEDMVENTYETASADLIAAVDLDTYELASAFSALTLDLNVLGGDTIDASGLKIFDILRDLEEIENRNGGSGVNSSSHSCDGGSGSGGGEDVDIEIDDTYSEADSEESLYSRCEFEDQFEDDEIADLSFEAGRESVYSSADAPEFSGLSAQLLSPLPRSRLSVASVTAPQYQLPLSQSPLPRSRLSFDLGSSHSVDSFAPGRGARSASSLPKIIDDEEGGVLLIPTKVTFAEKPPAKGKKTRFGKLFKFKSNP